MYARDIFDISKLVNSNRRSQQSVTDFVQFGPVQITEVTEPDPVHLRPDCAFTTHNRGGSRILVTGGFKCVSQ